MAHRGRVRKALVKGEGLPPLAVRTYHREASDDAASFGAKVFAFDQTLMQCRHFPLNYDSFGLFATIMHDRVVLVDGSGTTVAEQPIQVGVVHYVNGLFHKANCMGFMPPPP